jgi:hypothetical protein
LKKWLQAGEAGVMPAEHKALMSAVANHPLSITNVDIASEKESFLRRILELVKLEDCRRSWKSEPDYSLGIAKNCAFSELLSEVYPESVGPCIRIERLFNKISGYECPFF